MNLDKSEQMRIREFAKGVLAGVQTAIHETHIDVLGEDYWVSYGESLDVNLFVDEEGEWSCAVYPVVDGQTDGTQWIKIELNDEEDES